MNHTPNNNGTVVCTIGGTLLSVLSNIHSQDLVKTIVLAAIGATVSFGVSWLLKTVAGILRKKLCK